MSYFNNAKYNIVLYLPNGDKRIWIGVKSFELVEDTSRSGKAMVPVIRFISNENKLVYLSGCWSVEEM